MLVRHTSILYASFMAETQITTVADLIEHLGGPSKAGDVLGGVKTQRVWNWGAAGKIPAEFYLQHKAALALLGVKASDRIWFGDKVPSEAAE